MSHLTALRPTRRARLASVLVAAAALGPSLTGVAHAAPELDRPTSAPVAARHARVNVVTEWNRTLLTLVQVPGAQPATVQPTRDFAIMGAAVYDAVDAIRGDHEQYRTHLHAPPGASKTAAAAQAAHDVLVATFPGSASTLDAELAADLAHVRDHRARRAGVEVGARAAARLLTMRATDGAAAVPPTYQSSNAPGDYRATPPAFPTPVFTHWGAVTPFVLHRGGQFRPAPPPALDSPAYARAINQVESLGRDTSTTRTGEQATIAKFWAGPIQNYWNAITDDLLTARRASVVESAHTLALVDLGIADATIGLYDAKYTYRVWRPITAIRSADADGNPATTADPAWSPLATTPADPSYPGAHSTVSSAAATILTALYGDARFDVTSALLPGVTRHFTSFRAAVREAGFSRIYAGIHTSIDHRAGRILGRQVGEFTINHALNHTLDD